MPKPTGTQDRSAHLATVQRVVVKVGSRVVAPDGDLDEAAIAHLCAEIAALREGGLQVVLVSSGAVAAGWAYLGLAERPATIPLKQASAAAGQIRLLERYAHQLDRHGIRLAQLLLTAEDMRHRQRFLNARNTVTTLLERGFLPVINENDTVAVEEIKLGDNDQLSASVSNLVGAELLVILSDVAGLYDADPAVNPAAAVYPFIAAIEPEHVEAAGPSRGGGGLGGMVTKIEAARRAARAGAATVIAAGREPRVLQRIVSGETLGTFIAAGKGIGSRRHWIAYASEPRGSLHVDDGAATAVARRGKSLLPSGLVRVEGSFARGETVRIVDAAGEEIARGLAGYSAADMRRIRGLKSSEIEGVLGYTYLEEVVHRNDLVVRGLQSGPMGESAAELRASDDA